MILPMKEVELPLVLVLIIWYFELMCLFLVGDFVFWYIILSLFNCLFHHVKSFNSVLTQKFFLCLLIGLDLVTKATKEPCFDGNFALELDIAFEQFSVFLITIRALRVDCLH